VKYSPLDTASYAKDSNLQWLLPAPKRRIFVKFVFGIVTKICSRIPILFKKRKKKHETLHGGRKFSSRRESSLLPEHYALWGTSGGRRKTWRYKHNPALSIAHCFRAIDENWPETWLLGHISIIINFYVRSQNFEKRPLASSCLSVHMELGSHWTDFHKIWEFLENLSSRFKYHYPDKNKGYLTWRPLYLANFFLEYEMYQTKFVEKIKTHFLRSATF
jgi:hypothetical protein